MNLIEGMQLALSVPFPARGTKVPPVAPDRRSGSLHLAGGDRIQILGRSFVVQVSIQQWSRELLGWQLLDGSRNGLAMSTFLLTSDGPDEKSKMKIASKILKLS